MTDLRERVNRCGGPTVSDPVQTVDRVFLSQKISQLEQKWGSEVPLSGIQCRPWTGFS